MEEADVTGHNEQLIGPKLPEPPRVDMEDESLNTTVSLIRNTLKKVVCNLMLSFIFRMKEAHHCGLHAYIHVSKMSFFHIPQVESVPDLKPVEKKVKPRRRI